MLWGYVPFKEKDDDALYPKIKNANKILPKIIPDYLSEKCSEFLIGILNTNPENRMKVKEIKKHSWMKPKREVKIKWKSRNERRQIGSENIRSQARATIEFENGRKTKFKTEKANLIPLNFHDFFPNQRVTEAFLNNSMQFEDKVSQKYWNKKFEKPMKERRKYLQSLDIRDFKDKKMLENKLQFLSPLDCLNTKFELNHSFKNIKQGKSEKGGREKEFSSNFNWNSKNKVRT